MLEIYEEARGHILQMKQIAEDFDNELVKRAAILTKM